MAIYTVEVREKLNRATSEGEIIRLLTFIQENEAPAIARAKKALFGRERKLTEIRVLHTDALELAQGIISPYEELKAKWEAIQPPEYEKAEEFDSEALHRNMALFSQYCSDITQAVGPWFMDAYFRNDPYASIFGESMATIPGYTIKELLNKSERNYNIYPWHETWAVNWPYGAYLLYLWFSLMSCNRGGLFESYILKKSGIHKPADELYNLVEELSIN